MKHNPNFMDKINKDIQLRSVASKILGVKEFADFDTIKSAYRKAANKYHPDHNNGDEDAKQKFLLAKCAYEYLASGKDCGKLLEKIEFVNGDNFDEKYCTSNRWGHFLWWRDKFFKTEKYSKRNSKTNSCI